MFSEQPIKDELLNLWSGWS